VHVLCCAVLKAGNRGGELLGCIGRAKSFGLYPMAFPANLLFLFQSPLHIDDEQTRTRNEPDTVCHLIVTTLHVSTWV
jgi:hypothetical protein